MTNGITFGLRDHLRRIWIPALLLLTSVPLILTGCGGGGGGSSSSGGGNGGGGNGGGGVSFPASYAITDLGTFGGSQSVTNAINDSGQVVGWADDDAGEQIAFRYSNGQKKALSTQGSEALGINAAGQVVGEAAVPPGVSHAVYFQIGSTTSPVDLGALPGNIGISSQAWAINDVGQIVGDSETSAPLYHGTLYSIGSTIPTDLGTLGGINTTASAINDSGEIVGFSTVSTGSASGFRHAVIFHTGNPNPTDLGTLGGNESFASGINSQGQIVGYSQVSSGLYHAFVYSGGKMKDLGTFSGNQSSVLKIEDNGLILGSYSLAQTNAIGLFLYDTKTGKSTDLGSLRGRLSSADQAQWSNIYISGINSTYQICGGGTIGGKEHAFLMTPVVAGS